MRITIGLLLICIARSQHHEGGSGTTTIKTDDTEDEYVYFAPKNASVQLNMKYHIHYVEPAHFNNGTNQEMHWEI
jgi:hypothetical protein